VSQTRKYRQISPDQKAEIVLAGLCGGVRRRLWARTLALVGWDGAAAVAATQILLQLEWSIGLGRHDLVATAVERGHRVSTS
jgi:hypothetical protein